MATQMQETPTLHGDDAKKVLHQIHMKPTKEQIRKARERSDRLTALIKRV